MKKKSAVQLVQSNQTKSRTLAKKIFYGILISYFGEDGGKDSEVFV